MPVVDGRTIFYVPRNSSEPGPFDYNVHALNVETSIAGPLTTTPDSSRWRIVDAFEGDVLAIRSEAGSTVWTRIAGSSLSALRTASFPRTGSVVQWMSPRLTIVASDEDESFDIYVDGRFSARESDADAMTVRGTTAYFVATSTAGNEIVALDPFGSSSRREVLVAGSTSALRELRVTERWLYWSEPRGSLNDAGPVRRRRIGGGVVETLFSEQLPSRSCSPVDSEGDTVLVGCSPPESFGFDELFAVRDYGSVTKLEVDRWAALAALSGTDAVVWTEYDRQTDITGLPPLRLVPTGRLRYQSLDASPAQTIAELAEACTNCEDVLTPRPYITVSERVIMWNRALGNRPGFSWAYAERSCF